MDINSRFRLNDGSSIPALGVGVWKVPDGKAVEQAVLWGIEAGYRHFDTAAIYGNEKGVGSAIRKSGVQREELFITTKIWNDDHASPEKALETSLSRLQLDYVDLYLIHWPVRQRQDTWKAFERFVRNGRCRSIGVSNFTIRHLEELQGTVPAVNQVEFNPFLYQKELLEYCRKRSIQLEAYSPLMHGNRLDDKRLSAIAAGYSKSNAQVLLRWGLQKEVVVIPKSVNKDRIVENAGIFSFSISNRDMAALDALNENYRTCWDPTNIP